MKKIRPDVFLIIAIFISSCTSFKKIPYFTDLNHLQQTQQDVKNYSPLIIQPGDILSIFVSSRNTESSAIFNQNQGRSNSTFNDNPSENTTSGYKVDENGNIFLPVLGIYKVGGSTTSDISNKLSQSLLVYYKDPVVNVKLLNFKIAIYGDVLRPNVYTLQNERTTLTQALSLSGDLNITAVRKITLIREEGGVRKFIPIDLTSKETFESPYYYLKNNDEIYVQPDKTKYATVDRGYRTASLILSGLSIIAIVLSNLYRAN